MQNGIIKWFKRKLGIPPDETEIKTDEQTRPAAIQNLDEIAKRFAEKSLEIHNELGQINNQIPPETKKPGINKKLLSVAILLGVFVILLYFYVSNFFQFSFLKHEQIPTPNYEYKLSITHNGKPIEFDQPESVYDYFEYTIGLFNKTSRCVNSFGNVAIENASYTFDGKQNIFEWQNESQISKGNLGYFASQNYAFNLRVYGYPKGAYMVDTILTVLTNKHRFDSNLNYLELPKLSENFSANVDIPFFGSTIISKNQSTNKISVSSVLLDDWNGNESFMCTLDRVYDEITDKNIKDCDRVVAYLLPKKQQCARRYLSECGELNYVFYSSDARRVGKNIYCYFPNEDLSKGKVYNISIGFLKQVNPDLFIRYIKILDQTVES